MVKYLVHSHVGPAEVGSGALWSSVLPALHGLLLSRSVMVCLSLAGVSKAVENINKTIAPALVGEVGPIFVWRLLLRTRVQWLNYLICLVTF